MRGLIVAVCLLAASPVAAQPATPCNPNAGSWAIGTNAVAFYVCASDGLSWLTVGGGGSALPAGAVVMILAGTCPTGYEEATELAGKTLVGTVAANKDVGTTGGADDITPAGTNSAPTFTGNAWSAPAITWPAGVPTFAGDAFTAIINHTHPVTDPGHAHTQASTTTATGSGSNRLGTVDTSSTAVNTGTATTGVTTANPAGGVSSITPAGTIAWPAGVPTIGAYTPTGTVAAPTFTGTQFDNRAAFTYVIFCRKT